MSKKIIYHYEDVSFQLEKPEEVASWIKQIIEDEGFNLQIINYIFCSDEYILDVNKTYLNHDYYTDIITFVNSENKKEIISDIFISIDRVKENATDFEESFMDELHRVMAHGVLHLLGQKDKSLEESEEMRKREDACLSLRKFI